MTVLLTNLSDATVHRTVKPHILGVFGDICLAIGGEFKKYLEVVLQMLQQAASAQIDKVKARNFDVHSFGFFEKTKKKFNLENCFELFFFYFLTLEMFFDLLGANAHHYF